MRVYLKFLIIETYLIYIFTFSFSFLIRLNDSKIRYVLDCVHSFLCRLPIMRFSKIVIRFRNEIFYLNQMRLMFAIIWNINLWQRSIINNQNYVEMLKYRLTENTKHQCFSRCCKSYEWSHGIFVQEITISVKCRITKK